MLIHPSPCWTLGPLPFVQWKSAFAIEPEPESQAHGAETDPKTSPSCACCEQASSSASSSTSNDQDKKLDIDDDTEQGTAAILGESRDHAPPLPGEVSRPDFARHEEHEKDGGVPESAESVPNPKEPEE